MTAAKGLEQEVREGFRVSVGRGFAGRVAAERRAVTLSDVRPGDVVSLLPTRPVEAPGIETAARYVPGHDTGVGGDWYDVFSLPSGWLGVVEAGSLATVLYAMVSPDHATIRISLAGHLRPILAAPGQPAFLVEVPVDLPLGLGGRHHDRRYTDVPFPPGAVLVCYTDGLVERRSEVIDTGIECLRAAVAPGPAEHVCTTVMTRLAEERPGDDIAVLAIRRADPDV